MGRTLPIGIGPKDALDHIPWLGHALIFLQQMTKLEPKQISRKIQVDFESDLMFLQACPVHDIITKQIPESLRLVCHVFVQNDPSKKNTIIHYTHDVVAFKDKHRLCLPLALCLNSLNRKHIFRN
jgi:hypothetical protein